MKVELKCKKCAAILIGNSEITDEKVTCAACGTVNILPAVPPAPKTAPLDENLTVAERITATRKLIKAKASHDPLYKAHSAAILLLLDVAESLLPLIETAPPAKTAKPNR